MDNSLDQKLLKCIITDPKYIVESIVKIPNLYIDIEYRKIYNLLLKYYKKYKALPSYETFIEFGAASLEEDDVEQIKYIYSNEIKISPNDFNFYVKRIQERYNKKLI